MKSFDVIVAGAGMAGLLAARAAGENGLRVAVLERKSDPARMDRACGQTIPSMNEPMFGNVCDYNARDKRLCFSTDGFSLRYSGPYQNLYNLVMVTPSGHRVPFGGHDERKAMGDAGRVGMSFDKETMIQNMLDDARSVSVEVFPGAPVEAVTLTASGPEVQAGGQVFRSSYLIAADGVNSRVATILGLNRERHYYCQYRSISYYMRGLKFPAHDQMVKLVAYLPEGYAYAYIVPRPYPEEFNLLVLSTDPNISLERAAEYFTKESVSAPWFKGASKVRAMSAVCNCYSPILNPFRERVLIAGDAGATQEMENTGAMISGWKAGNAVAAAILEARIGLASTGIRQYLEWWRRSYTEPYSHELYIKGIAQQYILTSAEEVDYVFGLIKETLPACFNAYSSPTRQAMTKIMPVIREQRPDIFAKLQRKNTPAAELLEPLTRISSPVP